MKGLRNTAKNMLVYSVCAPRLEIDIPHMQSRNVSHFVFVFDETRALDVEVMSGVLIGLKCLFIFHESTLLVLVALNLAVLFLWK